MNKEFSDKISPEKREKFKSMVLEKPIQTIDKLRILTGCSISDGKLWVDNLREEIWYEKLPPCPYCGEKLRTPLAKQCRHCLRDWHDENDLKWLK